MASTPHGITRVLPERKARSLELPQNSQSSSVAGPDTNPGGTTDPDFEFAITKLPQVIVIEILKATLDTSDFLSGDALSLGLTCQYFYIYLKVLFPAPIRIKGREIQEVVEDFLPPEYVWFCPLNMFLDSELYGKGKVLRRRHLQERHNLYDQYEDLRLADWAKEAGFDSSVPRPFGMGKEWCTVVLGLLRSKDWKTARKVANKDGESKLELVTKWFDTLRVAGKRGLSIEKKLEDC